MINPKVLKQLKAYIQFLSTHQYINGSIAVAVKGQLIINEGFGYASFEHTITNTSRTRFKVGSITKSFTAVCILQLYEQGLLDIHRPICDYIDYPSAHNVTVHHLLTHSSGIPDFASFEDYWTRQMRLPATLDQTISTFKDKPLQFKPGTQFRYSNSGYILLTKIVEAVTDMSFNQYLVQNIITPIELHHTGLDNGVDIVQNYASGYTLDKTIVKAPFIDMSIPLGAFGLYSTVEDLFKYHNALQDNRLLSRQTLALMEQPYFERYGYGWFSYSELCGGRKCIGHYGDINGFSNQILRFPEEDIFIVVLSNLNLTPADAIARNIAAILNGEDLRAELFNSKESVPIKTQVLESIAGNYHFSKNGFNLSIQLEEGKWYASVSKRYGIVYQLELLCVGFSESSMQYITKHIYEQLTFFISEDGIKLKYIDCDGNFLQGYKIT